MVIVLRAFVAAMVFVSIANTAQANQGLFGGRTPYDGSINLRKSTTEQFDPIRGESVEARSRPDFDPTPISVGSFQLFPALNVAGFYDSNIYSDTTASKDDLVTKINPSLSAASNWGRHAVSFTGVGDFTTYVNNDEENYVGGAMQGEGRYDIDEKTWLAADAGFQKVTEPRGSASVIGAAAEPTQFNLYTAGVEAYRGLGILKVKGNYDFSFHEYGIQNLVPAPTTTNLNVRDRTSHKFSAEVSYEVSPNLQPFVRGNYSWTEYSLNSLRDSTGQNFNAGAKMDFGGIVTGELSAGYISRDYNGFASGIVEAVDFGGKALWNVTELTSIQGEFNRTIDETTVGGATLATAATGTLATGGSATVTHELRRDVILEANAAYTNYDYQNSPREDDQVEASAGGRYYINRNFYSDLTYDFIKRTSNAAGSDYDRHIALLRFGAQY